MACNFVYRIVKLFGGQIEVLVELNRIGVLLKQTTQIACLFGLCVLHLFQCFCSFDLCRSNRIFQFVPPCLDVRHPATCVRIELVSDSLFKLHDDVVVQRGADLDHLVCVFNQGIVAIGFEGRAVANQELT